MKILPRNTLKFVLILLLSALVLIGCNKNTNGTQPQIADKDSVGCLITNDFYAVHFSAYLKPSQDKEGLSAENREALLRPYCQELPNTGKAFFAADLIDRDVRKTPISIRLVELEKTGKDDTKADSFKEIHTILEVAPKLYPRGVVEAQADLNTNGYYALYLLIGGDEAISEDDKLRIQFHVGGDPNGLPLQIMILCAIGFVILISIASYLFYRHRKKRKAKQAEPIKPPKEIH
jgi:hypothetical protein